MDRTGRVAHHREVLEVDAGRVQESLALGTFHRRQSASFHGFGALAKAKNHVVGVKGIAHKAMLGALLKKGVGNMECRCSPAALRSPPVLDRDQ